MNSEKPFDDAISKAIADLEAKGVSREEINAIAEGVRQKQDREASRPVVTDPLDAISAKLDKLQESVDALATKLDQS